MRNAPGGTARPPTVLIVTADDRLLDDLLRLAAAAGVTPQVEIWGFSPNLSRLGEAVFVAIESGHPDACVLPDIYHIYRGGSDFAGLKLLSGAGLHVFHVNDYPTNKPRAEATDGRARNS